MHSSQKPCWKGRTKLLRKKATWPSFRPRRGQGPFQDASSMSTYLTICNLLFKQEILQKKREVPYGIQEEKRNNANKILNSIICTHHRSLVGKGGPSSSERRQRWPSFRPRRGQGPFQDASSMSTYLTICNLLIKSNKKF